MITIPIGAHVLLDVCPKWLLLMLDVRCIAFLVCQVSVGCAPHFPISLGDLLALHCIVSVACFAHKKQLLSCHVWLPPASLVYHGTLGLAPCLFVFDEACVLLRLASSQFRGHSLACAFESLAQLDLSTPKVVSRDCTHGCSSYQDL